MATLDHRAISRRELGDLLDAVDEAVGLRTQADLAEFADILEQSLPALVAKASAGAPVARCCPPSSFRFVVARDSDGLIAEIVVRPLAEQ
jgi:hypothetical protein